MRDSKDFVVDGTTESAEFSNPSNYSDGAFWAKVKHFAKKAGAKVIYYALLLYYAHASLKTPAWARIVILGALAYFICPFDLTPDIVPIVGFLDDLAILVAALKAMLGIFAKVRLVAPKTIARSEGKAVRVIDKRKI